MTEGYKKRWLEAGLPKCFDDIRSDSIDELLNTCLAWKKLCNDNRKSRELPNGDEYHYYEPIKKDGFECDIYPYNEISEIIRKAKTMGIFDDLFLRLLMKD